MNHIDVDLLDALSVYDATNDNKTSFGLEYVKAVKDKLMVEKESFLLNYRIILELQVQKMQTENKQANIINQLKDG